MRFRSAEVNKYTQEELRLMKTQDIKYIDLKAQAEAKVGHPPSAPLYTKKERP